MIVQDLIQYAARFPDEENKTYEFISFIEAHPDCFERTCVKGHLTGSSIIYNEDFTKVLLTHHKKLNKWLQLGGHADGDTDLSQVALKEAQEESGLENVEFCFDKKIIDIDLHLIPKNPKDEQHFHYDVRYCFKTKTPEKIKISHESKELRWIDISELSSYTQEESLLRLVKKSQELFFKNKNNS
jgi:8-oxo-dGTP pyrophosphatase MutT (NUDIX family)